MYLLFTTKLEHVTSSRSEDRFGYYDWRICAWYMPSHLVEGRLTPLLRARATVALYSWSRVVLLEQSSSGVPLR